MEAVRFYSFGEGGGCKRGGEVREYANVGLNGLITGYRTKPITYLGWGVGVGGEWERRSTG